MQIDSECLQKKKVNFICKKNENDSVDEKKNAN